MFLYVKFHDQNVSASTRIGFEMKSSSISGIKAKQKSASKKGK
jgi:hypothetical protein